MPVTDTLTGGVSTSTDLASAFLTANGMTMTQAIIYLIIVLFNIICLWILFKKAGRKGREAIIPIRNIYIVCKIVGKKKRFWALISPVMIGILWFIISIVFYFIGADGESLAMVIKHFLNWILGIASLIAFILEIIAMFIIIFNLAKKFGKSEGFGVGLLFLTPIFLGILAFGKAEYLGEEDNG